MIVAKANQQNEDKLFKITRNEQTTNFMRFISVYLCTEYKSWLILLIFSQK